MNDHNTDVPKKYDFPSRQFFQKHFGPDLDLDFNPHRGEVATKLHTELRRAFSLVLLSLPVYRLKDMNRAQIPFEPVFVFQQRELSAWVDPALAEKGLPELSGEAIAELFTELTTHCKKEEVRYGEWWHWETDDSSVWVEVTPDAITAGKNRRRTLSDLLGPQK
jgi:hypothetical protein